MNSTNIHDLFEQTQGMIKLATFFIIMNALLNIACFIIIVKINKKQDKLKIYAHNNSILKVKDACDQPDNVQKQQQNHKMVLAELIQKRQDLERDAINMTPLGEVTLTKHKIL